MERAISRLRFICWIAVSSCLLLSRGTLHSQSPEESLKAAMTSVILRSTQWPEDAFASKSSKFRIGIVGKRPPVKEFKAAFDGIKIANREVEIVALKSVDKAAHLQAVYFSNGDQDFLKKTIEELTKNSTITLGDHDAFIKNGGTINFRNIDGRLRFQFGRESMERTGVRVSAKVIRLAIKIDDEENPK